MSLRVAILADAYLHDKGVAINGSLVQLFNLAKAYSDRGVEVHYVSLTSDVSKSNQTTENGIQFHWIQSHKGLFNWRKSLNDFNEILEKIHPDAVYVRGRNVLQYVGGNYAKTTGKVFVWGTNGDDGAEFWKKTKRLLNKNKSIVKKFILYPLAVYEDFFINKGMKLATNIVVQNKHQANLVKKVLNRDSIIVNSYYLMAKEENSVRDQILWLGRWSPEKQPELFLEIAERVNNPEIKFVMAGDSKDENNRSLLMEKAKTIHVETPGKIPYNDVAKTISKSSLLVNTSYREGVSNTFIEAMLQGVPVISLNSNPNNWLTEHNIGFCAESDLSKLVDFIEKIWLDKNELNKMSDNAIEFAKQKFSNPDIIDQYINLFKVNA